MLERFETKNAGHFDLNFIVAGMEECSPGYCIKNFIREFYVVQYILKGKGEFYINGKKYNLCENHGFVLFPDMLDYYYKADMQDPWTYVWVGFKGIKVQTYLKQANLSLQSPVFLYGKDNALKNCIEEMLCISKKLSKSLDVKLLSLLYKFLSHLIDINDEKTYPCDDINSQSYYLNIALEYIEKNYWMDIKIADIANFISIDRKYLHSIFSNTLNISPKNYLTQYRLNKACEIMKTSDLPVSTIAHSVGYDDPLLFSRIFSKYKGVPPTKYRKCN